MAQIVLFVLILASWVTCPAVATTEGEGESAAGGGENPPPANPPNPAAPATPLRVCCFSGAEEKFVEYQPEGNGPKYVTDVCGPQFSDRERVGCEHVDPHNLVADRRNDLYCCHAALWFALIDRELTIYANHCKFP